MPKIGDFTHFTVKVPNVYPVHVLNKEVPEGWEVTDFRPLRYDDFFLGVADGAVWNMSSLPESSQRELRGAPRLIVKKVEPPKRFRYGLVAFGESPSNNGGYGDNYVAYYDIKSGKLEGVGKGHFLSVVDATCVAQALQKMANASDIVHTGEE